SGPPDTASTSDETCFQSANRRFASAPESTASSAVDALLLTVDALLHCGRRLRILARHLAVGRASRLLFLQRRQRWPEPQQRVRRLGGAIELGRDGEEGLRGVTVALPLVQAFAEPVVRLGRQSVARVFLQEGAQRLIGQRVVLALDIAVAEIELVARRIARRQGRDLWPGRRRL